MKDKKSIATILSILLILCGLGIVGRMDMESEQKDFLVYCSDIENNVYPDFKNLSEKCKNFSYK